MKIFALKLTASACVGLAAVVAVQEAQSEGRTEKPSPSSAALEGHQQTPADLKKEFPGKPAKAANRGAKRQPLGIIYVSGEVKAPGSVTVMKGMTVEEALRKAGGVTESGAVRGCALNRNGALTRVDLNTPEGKATMVEAGDRLMIPQRIW
ncbi:SLBB domain-containing protein [Haloferula sp. BvORR071]|uniref:SLBB domain-containing protein n=1 Tax=Haloferula sp. BvORR071 TaxID=1396141 RepID=UPI000556D94E|nr:SLBB domain-containing protein [Haloferula sp. BvORR071]